MSNPLKDWGMQWEPFIKYDGFQTCPNCGCWLFGEARAREIVWYHYIVGFSTSLPRETFRDGIVGIIILDCPKCQSKFWQHCSEMNYEAGQAFCPHWPQA